MNGSARARTAPAASLPVNLGRAVRAELRRALHPPYETPSVVIGNGLLMTACWTLLPAGLVDALFRFHGPLAFAMILASWMYSDVPATNLLGGDAARSVTALADPVMLRRLWFAKNIVLWLLVTPLCVATAAAIGVHEHDSVGAALTALWIMIVPAGALGFAAWLGIRFPYHPLPLRDRWSQRRRWRPMLVRWMVLVLAPYGLVPLLTFAVTLPSLLVWWAIARGEQDGRLNHLQFALGLMVAAGPAAGAWLLGHRYGSRRAHRRRAWLTEFLGDPRRG
ncbi:hypothetical protein [Krasilnikovia sp. MM14-A1259]|uniref:hypothetical protein n=1 Tax=Krasilnikovia sp. MM14-A1259 TaxID=3373539 RepID=UPI00380948D5